LFCEEESEVTPRNEGVRMFGAEDTLLCVECPAVEGLSVVEIASRLQECREIVERGEGVRMFGTEDTLLCVECPAV